MPPPSRDHDPQRQEQIEQLWWAKQLGHEPRTAAAPDNDETRQPDAPIAVEPRASAHENPAPARRELPLPLPVSLTRPEAPASEAPEADTRPERRSRPWFELRLSSRVSPSEYVLLRRAKELAGYLVGAMVAVLVVLLRRAAEVAGYLLVVVLAVLVAWLAVRLSS